MSKILPPSVISMISVVKFGCHSLFHWRILVQYLSQHCDSLYRYHLQRLFKFSFSFKRLLYAKLVIVRAIKAIFLFQKSQDFLGV